MRSTRRGLRDDPDRRIDRLNDDRYTWLFVLCPLTRRTEEIRRSEKVRERRGINISFRNPWKRYLDYDADINDEVICVYTMDCNISCSFYWNEIYWFS